MLGKLVLGCGALAASALVLTPPANAAGCGGYVNIAIWGCAPWDHNPPKRGVTPGYGTPKPAPAPPRQVARPAVPVVQGGSRIISNDGSTLISNRSNGLINQQNTSSSLINQQNTSSSFHR